MHFCKECQNMYYITLLKSDDEDDTKDHLSYHCRNCGTNDTTIATSNICISFIDMKPSSSNCGYLINEYTKFDPTLPKTNKIKCPNTSCEQYEETKEEI